MKHKRKLIDITPKKIEVKAITKKRPGMFYFKTEAGQEYSMTLKEKLFCELFLKLNGNGTEAIIQAGYNVSKKNGEVNRKLAQSIATEYLSKPVIFEYINSLLNASGFTEKNVHKQHAFLINQFADLNAKSKGIDMFYKRFALYPKDQAIMDALQKYKNLSDAELNAIIEGEVAKDE